MLQLLFLGAESHLIQFQGCPLLNFFLQKDAYKQRERQQMNFLVIETSSLANFILLYKEGKVTFTSLPLRELQHHLLVSIEKTLQDNSLEINDLDFVGVGNGPGSFTGTRIGVLTAKTLSFAKKIPLVSFCSLLPYTPPFTPSFTLLVPTSMERFFAYDGAGVKLILESEFREKCSLPFFSPDPTTIPVETARAELNIPFLVKVLKEKFLGNEVLGPHALKVSYLHEL